MTQSHHDDARTDAELITLTNRGEKAAFSALYLRYRDWVARLAHRFTGNHADSMDVLQDVFVYLVRKAPHLRLEGRMTTFLYPVTKSVAMTLIRKRGGAARTIERMSNADVSAMNASSSENHTEDLAIVLSRLPDHHREPLLMRYVDDMTNEEIASALGVPIGTVKSRIHHALQTLRDDPAARKYFSE